MTKRASIGARQGDNQTDLFGGAPPRAAKEARVADAGCTTKQIQAITGHATIAEVERYTRAADQERLAREAIRRLILSHT